MMKFRAYQIWKTLSLSSGNFTCCFVWL